MFTGLIKDIGKIDQVVRNGEGTLLKVLSNLCSEINIDDSVSINGACQTAVEVGERYFCVQAIKTTLDKTTLSSLKAGDEVNLELAMRLGDRFGGHIVQGHVNDIGKVSRILKRGKSYQVLIHVSSGLMKYIIKEGSITLDGISLTISDVFKNDCSFEVSIIPHTFENTVLKNKRIGSLINVEVDILGKYIENLILNDRNNNYINNFLS